MLQSQRGSTAGARQRGPARRPAPGTRQSRMRSRCLCAVVVDVFRVGGTGRKAFAILPRTPQECTKRAHTTIVLSPTGDASADGLQDDSKIAMKIPKRGHSENSRRASKAPKRAHGTLSSPFFVAACADHESPHFETRDSPFGCRLSPTARLNTSKCQR